MTTAPAVQITPIPAPPNNYDLTYENNRVRITNQNFTKLANMSGNQVSWTSWTPTITSDSGSFTTVAATSARWSRSNQTVTFTIVITLTTKNTAAGSFLVTLPRTPNSANFVASGVDNTSGVSLACLYQSGVGKLRITKYDGTDPLTNGHVYTITGSYEST